MRPNRRFEVPPRVVGRRQVGCTVSALEPCRFFDLTFPMHGYINKNVEKQK